MGRVLVVDDERGLRDALEVLINAKGHEVETAANVPDARAHLSRAFFDLVVTDLRLEPGGDGMDVVEAARNLESAPEVIVMTAYGSRQKAQLAISKGASFYLEKGPHLATDIDVLVAQAINTRRLQADNEQLRRALVGRYSVEGIVGKSEAMRETLDLVERIGPLKTTVLITGESGTGKERVAKALHYGGSTEGAFVPINCGAVPENLIESELFGHVKGAFTGADTDKVGLFEAAKGGTIFLDEIGELPLALQPKLLRALQERSIKRVGALEEVPVELRVIAATNRDLEAEVRAGRFREDLFFRLNVVQIDLPPLRRRLEDVPLLVSTFLRQFSKEYGRDVLQVDSAAMQALLNFGYPGNIRQLQNIIERGVALASDSTLHLSNLPKEVVHADTRPQRLVSVQDDSEFPDEGVDLERLVEDFEHGLIAKALEKAGGVKTKAAELLGLSFRQFRYKLSKNEQRYGRGQRGDSNA